MVWFCLCLWCLVGMFGDTYEMKAVSVVEGDSVTLHTDREMRNNDRIIWRIKMDRQTGCLTITDIGIEHSGRYELQTNSMKKVFILTVYGVVGDKDEMKSVMEGDSITLHTDTEMRNNDLIRWRFGNYLIAEINKTANSTTVYDGVLGGRFRDTLQVDNETGSLTFTNARIEHIGFYLAQTNLKEKGFTLYVYAPLPVPVFFSYCPPPSSPSASKCVLLCSVVNVSHVTLSWYKGNRLLSSISVSDLSISLSLPLEVENQDQNTYRCVLNNSFTEQTQHLDISESCRTCSGGCDTVEAVIRLVISGLMGVAAAAAVVVLYYDIRSRRAEQNQAYHHSHISAI
ncbi:hypothetical protein QQF64_023808 [Cirrhinus molitorella]|uniref:Ig-like domain-containing protein n=1 Tax=Cirrhinus molitorella TaxID=172907 RepID=A0ABR3NKM2_9TELE